MNGYRCCRLHHPLFKSSIALQRESWWQILSYCKSNSFSHQYYSFSLFSSWFIYPHISTTSHLSIRLNFLSFLSFLILPLAAYLYTSKPHFFVSLLTCPLSYSHRRLFFSPLHFSFNAEKSSGSPRCGNSNLLQSYINQTLPSISMSKTREKLSFFSEGKNSFEYCSGYRGQLWLAINFTHT